MAYRIYNSLPGRILLDNNMVIEQNSFIVVSRKDVTKQMVELRDKKVLSFQDLKDEPEEPKAKTFAEKVSDSSSENKPDIKSKPVDKAESISKSESLDKTDDKTEVVTKSKAKPKKTSKKLPSSDEIKSMSSK